MRRDTDKQGQCENVWCVNSFLFYISEVLNTNGFLRTNFLSGIEFNVYSVEMTVLKSGIFMGLLTSKHLKTCDPTHSQYKGFY